MSDNRSFEIAYQRSLVSGAAPDRNLHGSLIVALVPLVDAIPYNGSYLRTKGKFCCMIVRIAAKPNRKGPLATKIASIE